MTPTKRKKMTISIMDKMKQNGMPDAIPLDMTMSEEEEENPDRKRKKKAKPESALDSLAYKP